MQAIASSWTCAPYSVARADLIARELDLSPVTSAILARRGCETVPQARAFLAADERHDPWRLGQMEEACALILVHVRRGSRIVVHGDYDVDGVCSTAILVEALRALGADPSWHLPARQDGYGLSVATVERLAADGAALLVTVDCGITAPAEAAAARALGMDVVVTDHHRVGAELPDCPVVHPALGGYPFSELCAAGVAHKLSCALREAAGRRAEDAEEELDLVGLATVCDLVPLRGENRRLVREGLVALGRTQRPGLRALMGVAGLEGAAVDERAAGFRLGPRINAAGRLSRADAALELVLTRDPARAAEVADELDLLNRDRRDAETRALFAAEAQRAEQDGAPAYVIAGEGWHPGVVGIVASRISERHHRPCVVIALDAEGGRGSGRSIPAFDLHGGLAACAGHLRRFGGHRAAAGLEIDAARIEDFRRDFVAHAAASLAPEDLAPVTEVDAVAPGAALGIPLAEELRRLAPFGKGNPEPTLLVPGALVARARGMGAEAQHSRFTLVSSGSRAEAVAFRTTPGSLRAREAEPAHAAVSLELNEWNRMVEARVVLSELLPVAEGRCAPVGEDAGFWGRVEQALAADAPLRGPAPGGSARTVRDRRGEGLAAVLGDLLSSGEPVLVVCADVARRRDGLERLIAGLAGCAGKASERGEPGRLPVASWEDLACDPGLAAPFRHLVALDPPADEAALRSTECERDAPAFLHLAWGALEVDFALAVARSGLDLRTSLVDLYRRVRSVGGWLGGDALRAVLEGEGVHPRAPAHCARLLGVLEELGLVECERPDGGDPRCRTGSERPTELERSPLYRVCRERLTEAERYLVGEAARWRPVPARDGLVAAPQGGLASATAAAPA